MKSRVAIDTNVIVRLLTGDDENQAGLAVDLFRNYNCFIPKTVLVETEWVLRFSYRFEARAIGNALSKLLGMPNVVAEDHVNVATALEWFMTGMDFADALHLASSRSASTFVTFDKAMAKKGNRAGSIPIKNLLLGD